MCSDGGRSKHRQCQENQLGAITVSMPRLTDDHVVPFCGTIDGGIDGITAWPESNPCAPRERPSNGGVIRVRFAARGQLLPVAVREPRYRAAISSLTSVTPGTCLVTARAADRSAVSVTEPDSVTTPS